MDENINWIDLYKVLELSETEPDRDVWCLHEVSYKDFTLKAKDIKATIGNFDWSGFKFAPLDKHIEEYEPYTKFQILSAYNHDELVVMLNEFSRKHPASIIDVKYNTTCTNDKNENYNILHSVLITYND